MSADRRRLLAGAVLVAFAVAVSFGLSDYRLFQLTNVVGWAIAMLGLNVLTGYNGQISLGHGAFVAVGGYTVAITVREFDLPYLAGLALAFVICCLAGGLFGIPALRLPGISLALITLAMALALPQALRKFDGLTGGVMGISTPIERQFNAPEWTGVSTEHFRLLCFTALAALLFWAAFNIVRGRWGLAMMSVRDNPVSAASMGVDLAATKVTAFAISAGYAGVGGGVLAINVGFISPESVTLLVSIQLLTGIVIGGLGTVAGAVIGGLFVVYMPNFANELSDAAPGVIYGLIILLVMLLAPGGAIGLVRRAIARLGAPRSPRASVVTSDDVAPEDVATA